MATQSAPNKPELTIAISTLFGRSIANFDDQYPAGESWVYLILVQAPDPIADVDSTEFRQHWIGRRDVTVVLLEGTGVARSRNAALRLAETSLLLFSDDDVRLSGLGLEQIIEKFGKDRGLVLLAGRTLGVGGMHVKKYPSVANRLTLFNSAKFGTVELAVRRAPILHNGIRFDENFGAGASNPIGDEYIFITDCIKRDLSAEFHPIDIAEHPQISSGHVWQSEDHLLSRAKAITRVFGPGMAFLISLLFIAKHAGQFRGVRSVTKFLRQTLTID